VTTTAETVSTKIHASTRKTGAAIESTILQRLAEVTQEHAADCMGVSASTVSRMRDDITKLSQLLAALDLQVTSVSSMVISQDELSGLRAMAFEYLRAQREKDRRE
jgi:hypothetical protein